MEKIEFEDTMYFSSDNEDDQNIENCFQIQMKKIRKENFPRHLSKRHTLGAVPLKCPAPHWRITCKSVNLIDFLTKEIIAYAEFIKPSEAELKIREHIMSILQDLVKSLFKDASLHAFGSTATKTVLAKGDIDLVILNKVSQKDVVSGTLRKLHSHLRRHKEFIKVQLIDKAKVPIVKFVHQMSGISVDISCDQSNGITAANSMNAILKDRPFHPLLYVLKSLLRQHNLNEVRTGGIGSFALTIMLAGFLNSHPIASNPGFDMTANLGVMLLEFLECYGKNINSRYCGVSLNGFINNSENSSRLLVRDPDMKSNNVTGGSFSIYSVKAALHLAFIQLTDAIYIHTSQLRWFYDKITQTNDQGLNYNMIFVDDPPPLKGCPLPKTILGYVLNTGADIHKWHKTIHRIYNGIEKIGVANLSFDSPSVIEDIELNLSENEEPYRIPKKRQHSDEIILVDDLSEGEIETKKRKRDEWDE
eukprot:NODE_216_length_12483_cov_2.137516.p4 type:complete len:475 gc:universal NODE_216_length_12483_cov_2.137516:8265-6841(-)